MTEQTTDQSAKQSGLFRFLIKLMEGNMLSNLLGMILGPVFPPKVSRIDGHESVLLLQAIREGIITVVHPEPASTGVGRIQEWDNGRWNRVVKHG